MTLPDADTPRKPHRRRWLFGPYILLALLLVGWTGGWVYLRVTAARQLETSAQALRDAGYQVSWGSRTFSGYPFRLQAKLTEARIVEPSGWAITAPELTAEAAVYALGRWTAVAPQGVVLVRPIGGPVVIRGELLRASISDIGKRPPNIVVEGRKLIFAPLQGAAPYPLQTAERLDFNLRPGPDDQAAILFRVDNANAKMSGLLARIAQDRPVSMNWESILSHMSAFRGRNWPTAVQAWTASRGSISVRTAGLTAGDALATAKSGALTVGVDGRLQGALDVDLREAPAGARGGVLTPEAALAALSRLGGGDGTAQATITFTGGQTMLGPVAVGPAPRIY